MYIGESSFTPMATKVPYPLILPTSTANSCFFLPILTDHLPHKIGGCSLFCIPPLKRTDPKKRLSRCPNTSRNQGQIENYPLHRQYTSIVEFQIIRTNLKRVASIDYNSGEELPPFGEVEGTRATICERRWVRLRQRQREMSYPRGVESVERSRNVS